jgi:hypothetical protein
MHADKSNNNFLNFVIPTEPFFCDEEYAFGTADERRCTLIKAKT